MTSIRCDLRSRRECACCDSEICQQDPIVIAAGPYFRLTAMQQQFAFWLAIIFFAAISYPVLSSADHGFKKQLQDNQESRVTWTK